MTAQALPVYGLCLTGAQLEHQCMTSEYENVQLQLRACSLCIAVQQGKGGCITNAYMSMYFFCTLGLLELSMCTHEDGM